MSEKKSKFLLCPTYTYNARIRLTEAQQSLWRANVGKSEKCRKALASRIQYLFVKMSELS